MKVVTGENINAQHKLLNLHTRKLAEIYFLGCRGVVGRDFLKLRPLRW